MNRIATTLIVAAGITSTARADLVTVTATGDVAFNGISTGPLGGVSSGESVALSFEVDSNVFVDGIPGDTRGYAIDLSSFSLAFDSATLGLESPFPAGQTPYFTLVDGFPVSDGFFVSTSPVSPGGVPLEQTPFNFNLDLGYTGSTLSSLDILAALGTYDFTGLTRFGFNLWSIFPDNVALEINFEMLTIAAPLGTVVCSPAASNSTGGPAQISATGDILNPTLHVSGLPVGQNGYFLASDAFSATGGFIPPGSDGAFCLGIGANLGRYNSSTQQSDANGQVWLSIDPTAVPWAGGPGQGNPLTIDVTGQTWYFQFWYRDTPPPGRNNFSDVICIDFFLP